MVRKLLVELGILFLPVFLLALVFIHLTQYSVLLVGLQSVKVSKRSEEQCARSKSRLTSTAASFSALMRGAPFSSLMRFERSIESSASGARERLRSSILPLSNEGTGSEGVVAAVI